MGYLKRRCVNIEDGFPHPDDLYCGGASTCPDGYFCGKLNTNLYYDNISFDNLPYSLLVVFICVTMEGWSYIMVNVMQTFSIWIFAFFIPMVFIGSYFLMNLTLAVINYKFTEAHKSHVEKNK
jgi:voltage-gated sodium channel type XI alpha